MALKSVIDTIEEVPEALRGEYTQRDGKFHLSVEGMVPKARHDEFRDNNTTLKRTIEEMTAKFGGVDLEKYQELLDRDVKTREKKLIDAGKVEEMFNERLGALNTEHKTQIDGLTGQNTTLNKRLETLLIDGALTDAAIKAGVAPSAVEDVVLRGRNIFKLHEGSATAFDGEKQRFGKTGEALTMGEWLSGLSENASHLFTASQGGGARGNTNGSGAKTMSRADFMKLPGPDQAAAAKTMTIVD